MRGPEIFLDVIDAHDISKLDSYMKDDYIQHNAETKDGKAGFIDFTKEAFVMEPKMKIYKTLSNEDGEVLAFIKGTTKDGSENKIVYIFRLQDGLLVEHWDSIEYNIDKVTSKNGRDMFE